MNLLRILLDPIALLIAYCGENETPVIFIYIQKCDIYAETTYLRDEEHYPLASR